MAGTTVSLTLPCLSTTIQTFDNGLATFDGVPLWHGFDSSGCMLTLGMLFSYLYRISKTSAAKPVTFPLLILTVISLVKGT